MIRIAIIKCPLKYLLRDSMINMIRINNIKRSSIRIGIIEARIDQIKKILMAKGMIVSRELKSSFKVFWIIRMEISLKI